MLGVGDGDEAFQPGEGVARDAGDPGGGAAGGGARADGDGGEAQGKGGDEGAAVEVVEVRFEDQLVRAVDAYGGWGRRVGDGARRRARRAVDGLRGGVEDAGFSAESWGVGLWEGDDGVEEGLGGVEVYAGGEGGVFFAAERHYAVEEEDGVPGGAEGEEFCDGVRGGQVGGVEGEVLGRGET